MPIDKNGNISINAQELLQGTAQSPHLGFGHIRNLDIYSTQGVVKIQRRTENVLDLTSAGVGNVVSITRDSGTGDLYAGTDGTTAKVYKSSNGGATWAAISALDGTEIHSLKVWKDYLFVVRDTKIDAYGPLVGPIVLSSDWQTITSQTYHPTIVGQDDVLYIGDGPNVASISAFSAGSPPTATFNSSALDLPSQYKIKVMTELGRYLMLGTYVGTDIDDNQFGDIFPWDRVSPSFEIPVQTNDNGVSQFITENNRLIAQIGTKGRLIQSNLSATNDIALVPLINTTSDSLDSYPEATTAHDRELLLGFSAKNGFPAPLGVYSLKGNTLTLRNTISTGNDGSAAQIKIYALFSVNSFQYLIAWSDGSAIGMDLTDLDTKYDNYQAYFESPLYQSGTNLNKKTYTQMEYRLAKPLITGQSIRVKYRDDLNATWTTIGTFDTTNTEAGAVSHNFPALIADSEYIQLRVELSQEDTTAANSSPELKQIMLF